MSGWRDIGAHPAQQARLSLVQGMDGVEHGARFLEGRTSAGLGFRIALDRGGDLAELTFRGRMLGWEGPAQHPSATAPGPDAEEGLGLLRSFSGFLVTCGFDHFGPPRTGTADHFGYALRPRVHYPVHGRASFLPAEIEGKRREDHAFVIDLRLAQASLFGTQLDIRRRWDIALDRPFIRLTDRIANTGLSASPFMALYHINLGHPLIDTGTVIEGMPPDPGMPSPLPQMTADQTERGRFVARDQVADRVTVTAPDGTCLAIGFDRQRFSHVGQWWNRFSGMNVVAIEPATGPMPPLAAKPWAPPDWLHPGEERGLSIELAIEGPYA